MDFVILNVFSDPYFQFTGERANVAFIYQCLDSHITDLCLHVVISPFYWGTSRTAKGPSIGCGRFYFAVKPR
jgi:hypothetical protein